MVIGLCFFLDFYIKNHQKLSIWVQGRKLSIWLCGAEKMGTIHLKMEILIPAKCNKFETLPLSSTSAFFPNFVSLNWHCKTLTNNNITGKTYSAINGSFIHHTLYVKWYFLKEIRGFSIPLAWKGMGFCAVSKQCLKLARFGLP